MLTSTRIWVQAFTGKEKGRIGSVSEEIGRTKTDSKIWEKGGICKHYFQVVESQNNVAIWQFGNVAMKEGAPAVTLGVAAQAGNARPRFHHCHITALPHCHILYFRVL